jgi:response regulator RpfG family c-di-GMP phosphodiesterase
MDENRGKKAKILIVDDEIYIQEILKATLEDEGFECAAAGNAESALAVLASGEFDLAFVDMRLPDRQGIDLLKDIRASHPNVAVIVVSAVDSASTAIESMHLGAVDYIIKPFNLDQVLFSARRILDKRRLEEASGEYQKYLIQMADERAAENRRMFYSMTQVLIHLLDLKIPFNVGHALRVAEKSRYVAKELRMTDDGVRKVYLAALLHDVGMILVEDVLLHKKASLTPDEHRQFVERTTLAEEVLRPILSDEEVLKSIRHCHERYDGTGYPDRLKGNLIPLGARIISVVEAYDAMTVWRPYRPPRSPRESIAELGRCAPSQFDPQVVTVFSELYERIFKHSSQPAPEEP